MILEMVDIPYGAGSICADDAERIFPHDSKIYRVILTPARSTRRSLNRQIAYVIPSCKPTIQNATAALHHMPTLTVPFQHLVQRLRGLQLLQQSRCYTDGSYRNPTNPLHQLFRSAPPSHCGGAAVFMSSTADWRAHHIHAVQINDLIQLQPTSVYPAECISLVFAKYIHHSTDTTGEYYSDSQASRQALLSDTRTVAHRSCAFLLQAAKCMGGFDPNCLHYVPAHPERRLQNRADWQQDDWGNAIADAVAGQSNTIHDLATSLGTTITITSVSAIDILQALTQFVPYHLTSNGIPILDTPTEIANRQRHANYIATRDAEYHNNTPHWRNRSYAFAATISDQASSGVVRKASNAKRLYDKHLHGANVTKLNQPLPTDSTTHVHYAMQLIPVCMQHLHVRRPNW